MRCKHLLESYRKNSKIYFYINKKKFATLPCIFNVDLFLDFDDGFITIFIVSFLWAKLVVGRRSKVSPFPCTEHLGNIRSLLYRLCSTIALLVVVCQGYQNELKTPLYWFLKADTLPSI
jgi:hypothetical protein